MNSCPWEKIDGFSALSEFEHFDVWLNQQVTSAEVIQIEVSQPYLGATTFEEKWFKHLDSGQVWRLVCPDFSFTGLFERVV